MDFKQTYQHDEFIHFLRNFLPDDFENEQEELSRDFSFKFIEKVTKLGECESLDLKVYEIDHKSENDPRVALSKESFKLMRSFASRRSLIIFRNPKTQNYRLSLVTFQSSWTEGKKITVEYSNPRRYSFYLGPESKTKTPEKFLIKAGKVKDFDDLLTRFSVEVVNKDFYKEIAKFFNRLTGGDVKLTSKVQHFDPELTLPSVDQSDKKTYQEFAVRLIGRIIFCWFLKQKKSPADISLLPDEFLSKAAVLENKDYYHNVLEKIFFQVLNRPINQRNPELTNGYGKIPYLNGGLFDPHAEDFYENNQPSWNLKIPDGWFSDLFEILETYNFTIDENTVMDVDLSIDPEMLGRIFENLLAEINPETGESARKSTGSYYTPRPIVEYMVDQSLVQYLISKTEIANEKIQAIVSIDESDDELHPLSEEDRQRLVNALDEVKIVDPACGSGAFPIGMLQKIVWILSRADKDGKLWFEKKTEDLDPLFKEDFKKKFANENFDYIRKTGIIRDSIYGVDIQPIAVEVSKLRCFLTLIVDKDIDDEAENRGIKPLPNLEFKFVAANTLISLPGSQSSGQTGLFEHRDDIDRLKKLRDQYFGSSNFEKSEIRSKFKDIQREMFKKQIAVLGQGQMTMALADWDPFSDKSSTWFDPEWMFGIKYFDIAIANPPYIFARDSKNKGFDEDIKAYFYKNYCLAKYQLNLYPLFIEKADSLLNERGILTFITPNNWLTINSNIALRKFILDRKDISIVNFYSKVFESASVDSAVIVYSKSGLNRISLYQYVDHFELITEEDTKFFIDKKDLVINIEILKQAEFSALIDKVEENSSTLSNIANVKAGLQAYEVGKGDPTISKAMQNQRVYHSMSKEDQNYFKYIDGRNVSRYCVSWSGEYLKYGQNLAAPRNFDLFDQPRILVRQIPSKPPYCLNACFTEEVFLNDRNSNNIINSTVDYYYLLGLINSRLLSFWFMHKFGKLQRGTFPQFKVNELASFPIKIASADEMDVISNLAMEATNKKSEPDSDIFELDKQIDSIVYRIYGLTPEEIRIVEGTER